MLSRSRAIVGYIVVLVVLAALVSIFTDRSTFAWSLAGAVFIGVVVGDVAVRAIRSGAAPK